MHNCLRRAAVFSQSLFLLPAALVAGGLVVATTAPAQALASAVTYEICIRVPDKSDAGTDDGGLYVTLVGDTTSKAFKVDNSSADDLNRNTWSCWKHSGLGDLGFIRRMHLDMRDNDDVCYMQQYVRRYEYGVEKSISQFPGNGCLGNDSPSHTVWLTTSSKAPTKPVVVGKARGVWVVGCSGGQNCKTQMTKSLEIGGSKEASWSREVQNAVSVTVEAGVEFGPASASVSTTASHQTTRGSAGAIARSSSKGFESSCEQENNFTDYDVSVVYQWQVEVPVDGQLVSIRTCQIACRSSTGPEPQYGPLHPVTLDSCKKKVAAPAAAAPAPAAAQPQGQQSEVAQLAAALQMSEAELAEAVQQLEAEGFRNDAIELILGNEIAMLNGLPHLTEAELEARLRSMGYQF